MWYVPSPLSIEHRPCIIIKARNTSFHTLHVFFIFFSSSYLLFLFSFLIPLPHSSPPSIPLSLILSLSLSLVSPFNSSLPPSLTHSPFLISPYI